jgi:hypothetical protein
VLKNAYLEEVYDSTVTDAVTLFDQAFQNGVPEAATRAGKLLDYCGRIEEARIKYAAGIKFHSEEAAYKLGFLEEHKAEDFTAARIAYGQAIRFEKVVGKYTMNARYRLGCIAESEKRYILAIYFYKMVSKDSNKETIIRDEAIDSKKEMPLIKVEAKQKLSQRRWEGNTRTLSIHGEDSDAFIFPVDEA